VVMRRCGIEGFWDRKDRALGHVTILHSDSPNSTSLRIGALRSSAQYAVIHSLIRSLTRPLPHWLVLSFDKEDAFVIALSIPLNLPYHQFSHLTSPHLSLVRAALYTEPSHLCLGRGNYIILSTNNRSWFSRDSRVFP
jgi:hypothetical protein